MSSGRRLPNRIGTRAPGGGGLGGILSSSPKFPKIMRPFDDGARRDREESAEEASSLSEGLPYGSTGSSQPMPTLQYQETVV